MTGRVVLGLAVLAGCAGVPPGHPMLMAQHRQVRMIPDPVARSQAMEQIAMSAAYAGDPGTILAILDDLKGHPNHDALAVRCASYLEKQQKTQEARRVAKRITNPALRAETLASPKPKAQESEPTQASTG